MTSAIRSNNPIVLVARKAQREMWASYQLNKNADTLKLYKDATLNRVNIEKLNPIRISVTGVTTSKVSSSPAPAQVKLQKVEYSPLSRVSDYEGRKVMQLLKKEGDTFPYSFGVGKAKLILANIEAIKQFVSENDKLAS